MAGDVVRRIGMFFLPGAKDLQESPWRPPADVYRGPAGWLVKFDLAGVRPEDISLSVSGRRLILRGRRRDWFVEEGHRHYQMEISYSEFERSLELPCDLGSAQVTMEYRDGMLLVRILLECQT